MNRPPWWKRRLFTESGGFRLTFDDGPDPVETPHVLDWLAETGLKAIFFVLGRNIAGNEELLRRMIDDGHRIGNHTFTHPRFGLWDYGRAKGEIETCQAAIHDACGVVPTEVRPPFGRCTTGFLLAARQLGLRLSLWTLDSDDWRCRSEADVGRCAGELRRAMRAEDTILLHDNHRWILPVLASSFLTIQFSVPVSSRSTPVEAIRPA